MGKLESTIKSEIQRLAKRQIRSTFIPLRREVGAMRRKLSTLSKDITSLDKMAKELRLEEKARPELEATPEEVKASRLTPARIRGPRRKLGISMRELGILIETSPGAILSWEKGKFKPKGEKKAALVALRKLRKREVRKILAEKAKGEQAKRESKKMVAKPSKKPVSKKRIATISRKRGSPRPKGRK